MLQNSAGRYDAALTAATFAAAHPEALEFCHWGLVELIEAAAARCGRPERTAAAFERLLATTRASGTGWALGIEACCRALLSDETAEVHDREAVARLSSTRLRVPLARAHLLYGEWLRRKRRRTDAREQLRTAHAILTERRIEAFTERAARELLATGETARRRRFETNDQLTPQESQIARLARDGFANPDIAAQLFISRRTVECHLRKARARTPTWWAPGGPRRGPVAARAAGGQRAQPDVLAGRRPHAAGPRCGTAGRPVLRPQGVGPRLGGADRPGRAAGEAHLRVSGSASDPAGWGLPGQGARAGGLLDSGREIPAVADNIVLIMRFHPVGGEDVSVVTEDFGGEREALEAIAQALDDRRSLVLTQARYDREAGQSGVIINLANVVSVRVSKDRQRGGGPVHVTVAQPGGERSHLDPAPDPAASARSSPGHDQGTVRPGPGHGLRGFPALSADDEARTVVIARARQSRPRTAIPAPPVPRGGSGRPARGPWARAPPR